MFICMGWLRHFAYVLGPFRVGSRLCGPSRVGWKRTWSARKAAMVLKFSTVGSRFNIALIALRVMSSEPNWAERVETHSETEWVTNG